MLKTDFKDEIVKGIRKHQIVDVETGAIIHKGVVIKNISEIEQEGDVYGADEVNKEHELLNQLSNDNQIINADFQIWNCGETLIVNDNSSPYLADCHRCGYDGTGDFTKVTRTTNGLKLETTKVVAGANRCLLYQIENNDLKKSKGKKVTFSIKVRKLTSNSNVALTVSGIFEGRLNSTVVLNNTNFEIFNFSYVVKEDMTEHDWIYRLNNQSVVVGGGFEVAWLKLEFGEIATPFVPRSYAEELMLCQRYYYASPSINAMSYTYNDTFASFNIPIGTMRALPTITIGDVIIRDASGVDLPHSKVTISQSPGQLTIGVNCNPPSVADIKTRPRYCWMNYTADARIY